MHAFHYCGKKGILVFTQYIFPFVYMYIVYLQIHYNGYIYLRASDLPTQIYNLIQTIWIKISKGLKHPYILFQVQHFKCNLCNNNHSFNQLGHCERHITSVHSGFGWRCTECGTVLGRKGQKHGCENGKMVLVKRTTMTMTKEEAEEFAKFQQDKTQHVKPIMEKVPIQFSDQPYQNGQPNKRRAKLTEAPAMKKVKKVAEKTAAPFVRTEKPASVTKSSTITTKADIHTSDESNRKPIPKTPTLSPPSRSFKRLFGDVSDESDSDSDNEVEDILSSPDVSVHEAPRTVVSELVHEKTTIEMATQTGETLEADIGPLNKTRIDQLDRIYLNVGGKLFLTTRNTLRRAPDSLLAKMLDQKVKSYSERNNVPEYFLDRDPCHFGLILHYLRDGPLGVACHLPSELGTLRQIHLEAVYYGIDKFANLLATRFTRFMFGDAPELLEE